MVMSIGQIHINDGILRYPIDKLTNISLDWFFREDSQEPIAFYDQKRKGGSQICSPSNDWILECQISKQPHLGQP